MCHPITSIANLRGAQRGIEGRRVSALFTSQCTGTHINWRNDYYKKLLNYVHIDSYGKCHHNTKQKEDRYTAPNWRNSVLDTLKKYRSYVTFENVIEPEYITEKIWIAYAAGKYHIIVTILRGPGDYNYNQVLATQCKLQI